MKIIKNSPIFAQNAKNKIKIKRLPAIAVEGFLISIFDQNQTWKIVFTKKC